MYLPSKRKWNSLSDLRDHLKRDTTEQVLSFNGHQLVTRAATYTLAHGEISAMANTKKNAGKAPTKAPAKAPAKKAPAKKK
jgi:hypothetical protein